MKNFSLPLDVPPRMRRRSAPIARIGVAAALALLGLAILVGSLGLDPESTIGTVFFPMLGIMTLLSGVGAFVAGTAAMLLAHDRSVGTILATLAGGLLGWFMIVELFIEG